MITITMDDSPERLALAYELMEAEGLSLAEALDAAALMEDGLMAYAVSYDHHRIRERIRDAVYNLRAREVVDALGKAKKANVSVQVRVDWRQM